MNAWKSNQYLQPLNFPNINNIYPQLTPLTNDYIKNSWAKQYIQDMRNQKPKLSNISPAQEQYFNRDTLSFSPAYSQISPTNAMQDAQLNTAIGNYAHANNIDFKTYLALQQQAMAESRLTGQNYSDTLFNAVKSYSNNPLNGAKNNNVGGGNSSFNWDVVANGIGMTQDIVGIGTGVINMGLGINHAIQNNKLNKEQLALMRLQREDLVESLQRKREEYARLKGARRKANQQVYQSSATKTNY